MNTLLLLLSESLLSLTISAIVLTVMAQPLRQVLERLCPDEQAAGFWLRYSKVMLTIAPLLLVLVLDLMTPFDDPFEVLRLALVAALAGLLICLHLIGNRLGRFVTTTPQPWGKP